MILLITIFLIPISSIYAAPLVRPGIDQLFQPPYVNQIENKRLGLLTNNAGVNASGTSTIDLLARHAHLVALFAAEHGLRERHDENYRDGIDPVTHLPVYSLYGPRKVPSAEEFSHIDALVIDLQDVGLRYYTYASTMALIMKAAAKYHKMVIVLDRPNPLGGNIVEGPILEDRLIGLFTSYYPVPMRHGLTFGELALYFNRYFHIGCNLLVIPMQGWQRWMLFNQTHLTWHAPSPALPTFKQAFLYNVFGVLESLNLSVGRSLNNKYAFEIFGAPWIHKHVEQNLVKKLNAAQLPGLTFHFYQWVPNRAIFKNRLCSGFAVNVTSIQKVQAFYSLLTVLKILRQEFGTGIGLREIDGMVGQDWVADAIKENVSVKTIIAQINRDNQIFIAKRKAILLYH